MYQVIVGDIKFAACHTRKFAEICAKQFFSAKVVKTPFFIQPAYTLQHEWNLLKLLGA